MDETQQIMELLRGLQEDVAALKAQEIATSLPQQDDRVSGIEKVVQELKEELLGMRDLMDKSVDMERGGVSQTAVPALQSKGMAAPGGMSSEQLQEFKKQTLQINGLQQKMKDLESKLTDAIANIKKGNERAGEMEEKGEENVKDLYSTIDQINNSLSEKIALQRVEMQKIAGDTPKAVNYDPFNYGEAYTGDFVDFQARKRITEIKLLLQSLQAAMNSLRESVKVSPTVDLGYKVVRLDQLLAATGFQEAIETGEASHEDVVVITQPTSREPGRIEMPKKEIFQTSEDMESKWAITDSIMQTMYRLEIELSELQKLHGSSETLGQSKVIEDIQHSIRQLKERQLDSKTVKRLVDDYVLMSAPARNRQASVDFKPQREDLISRAAMEDTAQPIKYLQAVVEGMLKRLKDLEFNFQTRPGAAIKKFKKGDTRAACLSCDMGIDANYVYKTSKFAPRGDLFDPAARNVQGLVKMPARSQYVISRTYTIDTSNVTSDIYVIPRPCGASYTVYWPVVDPKVGKKPIQETNVALETKRNFIRGRDGHYYVGCDVPVVKSEYQNQKRLPVAILKADVHGRTCSTYKTSDGTKVCRDIQYRGKQAQITTLLVKKEIRKSAVSSGVSVTGQKKESISKLIQNPMAEKVQPILERNSEFAAELEQETQDKPLVEISMDDADEPPVEDNVEDTNEQPVEINYEVQDEQELDNATFFEDTSENANPGPAVWKVSQDDNNNANPRPKRLTSHTVTFTHIMDLMSAANSWFPKQHDEVTNMPGSADSSLSSSFTSIICLPSEERTISYPFVVSDGHKSSNTRGNTQTQEYGLDTVTNKYIDKETNKHVNKHHRKQQKQSLYLVERIPRKPSVTWQICDIKSQTCSPAHKLPDFPPEPVQIAQFQSGPVANSFRQQQELPASYHKAVDKKIMQLKFRMQKDLPDWHLQQYSRHRRHEECMQLPPLTQNLRRIQHERPGACQQQPTMSPRRGQSLWTNLEDSEFDLLQVEIEKHQKLKSIGYWLDCTNNHHKDMINVSQAKKRHHIYTALK